MHGLSFLLYLQMSPQCTFNTRGLWQRQPRLLVLFRLAQQDLLHSQPSDWLSLTEKHSILWFLIQKFLNRAQVYFTLPTPESIPVMAGNYCMSAPRGRKSRMRNSWDCPFKCMQSVSNHLVIYTSLVPIKLPICHCIFRDLLSKRPGKVDFKWPFTPLTNRFEIILFFTCYSAANDLCQSDKIHLKYISLYSGSVIKVNV